MPLHDVSLVEGGLSALSVPLCLKAHFCQAEIYNLRGHVSKNGKADSIRGLTLSGTKTHVKQRFLPLTPLLMVSDVLWSPVLPA
ncbi:TPA: hypothetical protein HML79_27435 [Escherichia coli]|nr:hypothetical protein [Escherichia coli]EEY7920027.1 hypothetical protein [Escherichia coli]EGD4490309.1 hypothetical protein [Escherichia coli]HAJ1862144.1 hypothetical protein [Escherichia coli]HAJ1862544.1 hypothetical protein [Escherichia coli]